MRSFVEAVVFFDVRILGGLGLTGWKVAAVEGGVAVALVLSD